MPGLLRPGPADIDRRLDLEPFELISVRAFAVGGWSGLRARTA